MSGKAIRETLAALGVIASMVFVGVEIQQNTRLVEAQLESDEYSGWVAIDASKQGEAFSEVLAKAIERPEDLTLPEMLELDGYLYTYFDLLWRRQNLHQMGLGHSLEVELTQTVYDYLGNRFARAWWEETKFKFEPSFIDAVEAAMPSVSADQDEEFFGRIATRLNDGDRPIP